MTSVEVDPLPVRDREREYFRLTRRIDRCTRRISEESSPRKVLEKLVPQLERLDHRYQFLDEIYHPTPLPLDRV